MWSSTLNITLLSSGVTLDGRWLPLWPSLCTAEHCEPHEIKLPLKRRFTLLTRHLPCTLSLSLSHHLLFLLASFAVSTVCICISFHLLCSSSNTVSSMIWGSRENVRSEKRKCSDPWRAHKFNIFISPSLPLKVLGSAFCESISHNIVREAMVMHEDTSTQFIPEQVLSVR